MNTETTNNEQPISVKELYYKCTFFDGTERLKIPYAEIHKAINVDDYNRVVEIINYFIEKMSDDVSIVR